MRNIAVAPRSEWVTTGPSDVTRTKRHRFADWLATAPIVVMIVASMLPFGVAVGAEPRLQVVPDAVKPGATVSVAGSGFGKGETGEVRLDGSTDGAVAYRASGRGQFEVSLRTPADAALGDHVVVAVAIPSSKNGSAAKRSQSSTTSAAPVERARTKVTLSTAPVATATPAPASSAPTLAPTPAPTPPPPTVAPTAAPTQTPTQTPTQAPSASPPPTQPTAPPPEPTSAPTAAPTATPTPGPAWGLAGGYSGIDLADVRGRGVGVLLVEMRWASAEPTEGAFSTSYFAAKRDEIARYRAAGFRVVLNYGMHHAPAWLLAKPNARFVQQAGLVYAASDEPNLVFATELRPYAERYTARVFAELGTDFAAVRVGGGHWGELTYPQLFGSDGRLINNYWAFDGAAARTNPVPGWKPGMPSPAAEASRFLAWYLDRLTAFQNWQIATVRASFAGPIAVLYASWGMRSGDFDRAVATNLAGTSSPEINGEVQRGFDHARHVAAITDRGAVVWGTYGERVGTVSWLSSLAAPRGLALMAENSGSDGPAAMDAAMAEARRYGLRLFMWIRASEAYCSCNGYATIADYETRIASSP